MLEFNFEPFAEPQLSLEEPKREVKFSNIQPKYRPVYNPYYRPAPYQSSPQSYQAWDNTPQQNYIVPKPKSYLWIWILAIGAIGLVLYNYKKAEINSFLLKLKDNYFPDNPEEVS